MSSGPSAMHQYVSKALELAATDGRIGSLCVRIDVASGKMLSKRARGGGRGIFRRNESSPCWPSCARQTTGRFGRLPPRKASRKPRCTTGDGTLGSVGRCTPTLGQIRKAGARETSLPAVVETAAMNEAERGEYCRSHGLYPQQLSDWRLAM